MNFPDLSAIPQGVKAAVQVIVGVALLYQYFKNGKKKVEEDHALAELNVALMMGAFAFMLIAMVISVVIYGADKEGFLVALNNIIWITWILIVIIALIFTYKFRKKKPVQ